jgi:hypothetical protein
MLLFAFVSALYAFSAAVLVRILAPPFMTAGIAFVPPCTLCYNMFDAASCRLSGIFDTPKKNFNAQPKNFSGTTMIIHILRFYTCCYDNNQALLSSSSPDKTVINKHKYFLLQH